MESSNQSGLGTSLNDVMHRRLKNRERQRRYREKKRLRADSGKVFVNQQSSQMQIVILPTDVPIVQAVTRVYSKRDWKKDARRVHSVNQEAISNGFASIGQSSAGEKQVPHCGSHETDQTHNCEVPSACAGNSGCMSNSEIVRSRLAKRDWKSEARSKRN